MIRVALNHKSIYEYDRAVEMNPHVVRLRPAPHCRTPINSYSLRVLPGKHFLNWQQDPHSNHLARLIFNGETTLFEVEVDLVAEMTVVNPFDFFLEPDAEMFPFKYEESLAKDLLPFLHVHPAGPELTALFESVDMTPTKTIDFIVDLNRRLQQIVSYVVRLEHGVQTPEETLELGSGSCRDSAWLMVQLLRRLGLAARFVSGYLIQLKPDVESLDGPSGATEDFTDLHAWAEVYLPGAGWIGLDPTSGLLAGEGHIPLACTPEPINAAPITGSIGECEVTFRHEMTVTRVHEDPRVTKPYSDAEWQRIEATGHEVDELLNQGDVRLTMGGEPTFVSIDDMDGDEWKTAAIGPNKRRLAGNLISRLRERYADGGLIHYGQGKWYPGEPLPRWALTCMWRTDGQPMWDNTALLADPNQDYGHTVEHAEQFSAALAKRLDVNPEHIAPAYEDAMYYVWKERRLAVNTEVHKADLEDKEERARLARVFGQGLTAKVGCVLPLVHQWWNAQPRWLSGQWPVRPEQMFLVPGDSPMGLRLPLDSLPVEGPGDYVSVPVVPFEPSKQLPDFEFFRQNYSARLNSQSTRARTRDHALQPVGPGGELSESAENSSEDNSSPEEQPPHNDITRKEYESGIVRTAMCFEVRNGVLHVFMPPVDRLEDYLDLITAIEQTAAELEMPVIIEGYLPPSDYRLQHVKVTPDPGVIEVNVQPAENWPELVSIASGIYEDARLSRLGTEKFDVDGTHTGTGGGNHVVMGALTPADSPFLRRPDLLRSLVAYWHNHPSLSYLFSGRFIGPTSQAPRVDEGRGDATYELQIAFEQIPEKGPCPPWLVDRVFRHLLVDLTGNTHRAEFCIDKLYSPDSATGRLGLVEFRAFEMPPHWQMSLTQQLLLRALVARFWEKPYQAKLMDWYRSIHDRWMLPHFIRQDFNDVIEETAVAGISLDADWFAPHFEFRFPVIGEMEQMGISLELRTAVEPWYVLGEEPAGGATARYVDSSVQRLQVKARGMFDARHVITCNGRKVPLHPTGTAGEFVAGVRYRAWQPPNCLHPTIPVDEPLVFDVLDTWLGRSVGGCKYHVGHPGGRNPDDFPVNAYEAEGRRASRFFKMGHTGGATTIPDDEQNEVFPFTLDLRRNRVKV
ncbi:Transglutaminase-like superfamily protein [Symmachiella macrocystis]|uniref:Transglutaminase-like superfamily protein n=1 Tax=Symmachiella macrocystis TaxID=2527985 RepID=A0A5C6BJV4_9PLAN|nr:transglutaminase family protein [Symmachiella macrocystis]TWU11576.1 Transglutaminase-like superfamily protein [Symmachiella macrocystis]